MLQDQDDFNKIFAAHNSAPSQTQRTEDADVLLTQLPPKSILKGLIDLYFSHYNWQYFIIERFYFDELLACWESADPGLVTYLSREELAQELRYFPVLLFQVLALAVLVIPPDTSELASLSRNQFRSAQRYSDIGIELMERLGKQGFTLTAVQANILRSSLLKSLGRGIDSWHCLGTAIRSVVNYRL